MIMNNHHDHHNHHPSTQLFLPGVIVGAGLMFLLGTKKGREVLKVLMEEGVDRVSDYLTHEHPFHSNSSHIESEDAFEKEVHRNGHHKPAKVHKG